MGYWGFPIYESGTHLAALLPDDVYILQYRVVMSKEYSADWPELYEVMIEGWHPRVFGYDMTSSLRNTVMYLSSNPAFGNAVLDIRLPAGTTADIGIYDLSGHLIATLQDGYISGGEHSFAVEGLQPGVYLIRFRTPVYEEIEELTILR